MPAHLLIQAAAQSALIAGIEAQLLTTFDGTNTSSPNDQAISLTVAQRTLATLTYMGLLMALSATINSLILTQEFAVLEFRAAQRPQSALMTWHTTTIDATSTSIITLSNGGRSRWTKAVLHRECTASQPLLVH